MTKTLIGYARCSADKQDLTGQRRALIELGVPEDRIYTDHGLSGRNRDRTGRGPRRRDIGRTQARSPCPISAGRPGHRR